MAELQKEAEEWTGLGQHPNIAYWYSLHPLGDLPLFVVQYAAGGTLRNRISDSAEAVHDLRSNLDLAIQLCHALEHAHDRPDPSPLPTCSLSSSTTDQTSA